MHTFSKVSDQGCLTLKTCKDEVFEAEGWAEGWARERARRECDLMKLMNLKKGGITLSFTSPEKGFCMYVYVFIYKYEVFT
jgi:hypothetical protein